MRAWPRRFTVTGALLLSLLGTVGAWAQPLEVLRVGTSGDYPPFSRAGTGFDHEVAELLAADLGLRLQWVPFRWPELGQAVKRGDFDVAMSGVTWRPGRAVVGWMSRAVAMGGPCVVGQADPQRIAVNLGGILERWTRKRFKERRIRAVDDNLSLPRLLAEGEVDAFVTDSFEVAHFRRPGPESWPERCEVPRDRKVYWITPRGGNELGERIDAWLLRREPEIDALRVVHFGSSAPRDEVDHLLDLLHRRLSYMPQVAAWKRRRGVPLEDPEREARVLEEARREAESRGLEPASLVELFRVQIELAKAVQGRTEEEEPTLDLETEIRPTLLRLGRRIVEALAPSLPLDAPRLTEDRLALLDDLLEPTEITKLYHALRALGPASSPAVQQIPPRSHGWGVDAAPPADL